MYGESLLYGLIIGLTGCSLCSYPLVSVSSNYKKSILYIFLSRGLAALIALPLIFLVFYAGLASSIIMLGIGTYGFMCALEGKNSRAGRNPLYLLLRYVCLKVPLQFSHPQVS